MDIFNLPEWELMGRILFALLMGLLIGIQRTRTGATAGMRTYALVSLGAALFVVTAGMVSAMYTGPINFDPLRVAAQIVVGVGFLGAGVIFTHGRDITGLTTAAGLWVAAGIGMASGFGLFGMAAFTTLLTIFTLEVLYHVEERYVAEE